MSLEHVALQILGCSWFYLRSADTKLFKLREVPREIYTTTWLGQNTEGSVFSLQPTSVSTITSSAKNPNQAETVQISTWTATPIWAGPPLALTCTLFDKWLPGCYKGNRNYVRKACFCISCISEQLRSQNTNSGCAELTCPTHNCLPCTFRPFITASVRYMHTRNLGPNSALYVTALVSIGKVKLKRRKPSVRTHTNTHADAFFICQTEWCGFKWFSLICWVWRCTQTRACVCLLVGWEEGVDMENLEPKRYFFVDLLCFFCLVFAMPLWASVYMCIVVTCLESWPFGSRSWCVTLSLSLSHWYPGSGVVLGCIDSWSLHPYLHRLT